MLHTIVSARLMLVRKGLRFLIGACGCLFVGVQLMFEYRCVADFFFMLFLLGRVSV